MRAAQTNRRHLSLFVLRSCLKRSLPKAPFVSATRSNKRIELWHGLQRHVV